MDGSPSPAVEQGLYRIAQEALENIVRHAEARALVVRLEQKDHRLVLIVQDDGRGMAGDGREPSGTEAEDRLGIRGMEERASVIGGLLQITTEEKLGTTVHLTVPLRT
jgi:signal transduction histidine kinase